MQSALTPVTRDLLLIGGGHSHVTVLKRFGMEPMAGVRITLVCRDMHAPYSGMLPGLISGHYEFDDVHIDLAPLAQFAGVRFLHDEVVGLDRIGKRVLCRDHPPVAYDVLSIDIGSSPRTGDVDGAGKLVVSVKPIDGFARKWAAMQDRILARRQPTVIAVVGGGAGGVELLLSVQYRLRQELERLGRSAQYLEFDLYTGTRDVLATHNGWVRAKFRRVLADRGVRVHTGRRVLRVERAEQIMLHLEGGGSAAADEVLWVTTAGAQQWPAKAGLEVDGAGFIKVNDALQTLTDPDIFAAGDIADVVNHPRPKAGVFAVRQGPPLEANLRRRLRGEPLRPFTPQREFLSLVSTGDKYAVASRSFWSIEGAWVWRWKDWIDRRFMDKFNQLPDMELEHEAGSADADSPTLEVIAAAPMRCGGCGSKVGAGVLERVLARLDPVRRDDVIVGLDAPDDAAVIEVPEGHMLVQTVDQFRAFLDDPFIFGKVTANHALGDIYAMGAEPQTAMAMVTVPYAAEDKMEEDIFQLLAGALEVFREAGTALVGGHTSEGAEMTLGFALSGLVDRDKLLRKAGMQPGDALILTKPVGTGALFAAHMRRKAKGRWIESALRSMLRSNRQAAECLRHHSATAMTDVTGFGLLGHLVEMLRASGVAAEVKLASIPVLDGALEVVGAGIFSSLQPHNVRLRRAICNVEEAAAHARYPLLFDPQTAGGLLASVPAGDCAGCLEKLRASGYDAACVGSVVPASAAERVTLIV